MNKVLHLQCVQTWNTCNQGTFLKIKKGYGMKCLSFMKIIHIYAKFIYKVWNSNTAFTELSLSLSIYI